jgi:hypothetical protein
MIFDRAASGYIAFNCPNNTYGATLKTNGLKFQPCKPCPRGLYSPPLSSNLTDCKNYGGFGFNGQTAEPCPAGSYAPANQKITCAPCEVHRSTTGNTSPPYFTDTTLPATITIIGDAQDSVEDCKVLPGFGITGVPSGNATEDALMEVQPCQIGNFSLGGTITTTCDPCPPRTTNNATESTTCDSK